MAANTPNGDELITAVFADQMLEQIMSAPSPLEAMFGLYEPRKFTRREKIGLRIHSMRTRLAVKLAPWLDDGDW